METESENSKQRGERGQTAEKKQEDNRKSSLVKFHLYKKSILSPKHHYIKHNNKTPTNKKNLQDFKTENIFPLLLLFLFF